MIAKFDKLNQNISNEGAKARDKELVRAIRVINRADVIECSADNVIDCRLYMGRNNYASTVYCNIWLYHGKGAGSGKAGGYGYDKRSAAVSSALDHLGVKLYHDDGIKPYHIAGIGDGAIRSALIALAVALGYSEENLIYVECYA